MDKKKLFLYPLLITIIGLLSVITLGKISVPTNAIDTSDGISYTSSQTISSTETIDLNAANYILGNTYYLNISPIGVLTINDTSSGKTYHFEKEVEGVQNPFYDYNYLGDDASSGDETINTGFVIDTIIYNTGSLTINGGTFINCKIINATHATTTINGGTFISCTSRLQYMIENQNDATLDINGGTFSFATNGVISNDKGTVTIDNATFKNNFATSGAVITSNVGSVTINSGSFVYNNATKGAIINDIGSTIEIHGGSFENNSATEGAVITAETSNITIDGGTFTNNTATKYNYFELFNTTLTLDGGTFNNLNNNSIYFDLSKTDGTKGTLIIKSGFTTTSEGFIVFGATYASYECLVSGANDTDVTVYFNNNLDGTYENRVISGNNFIYYKVKPHSHGSGASVIYDRCIVNGTSALTSGNYYLYIDYLTNNLTVAAGETVNICLRGKALNLNGYRIINNGTLNISDCGTDTYYFNEGDDDFWVISQSASSDYSVTGGVIYGGSSDSVNGSAIQNNGTLKLINVNLVGNYTAGNGTIYNANGASLEVNGGSIQGNCVGGEGSAIYSLGTTTLKSGVEIKYNYTYDGMAVYSTNLTLESVTISDNITYNQHSTVIYSDNDITINSGVVKIFDNTWYVSNKKNGSLNIDIDDIMFSITSLSTGSNIVLDYEQDDPYTFTNAITTSSYKSYFSCADEDYKIGYTQDGDDYYLVIHLAYTVTYDDNDSTSGSVPTDNNEYVSGDTVTVLGNTGTLKKTDYIFGGWAETANGTTPVTSFTITGNKTLYAIWTEKKAISFTETTQSFEYDGTAKSFALTDITDSLASSSFTVSYKDSSNNVVASPTVPGTYTVIVTREEDDTYKHVDKTLTGALVITKMRVTPTFIAADDFTYNGSNQASSLSATFKNISNVNCDLYLYDSNFDFTDAGEYKVKFKLSESDAALYGFTTSLLDYTETTYHIKKATPVIDASGVAKEYTYSPSGITLTGATCAENNDTGKTIVYTPATLTSAGTHSVTISMAATKNFNAAENLTFNVTVNKANYDMSGVSWNYTTGLPYTTTEQTVTIIGTLPTGVTVKDYFGNTGTAVASYSATVDFNYDSTNYNEPTLGSLNWEIVKATISINQTAQSFTYDAQAHAFEIKNATNGVTGFTVVYYEPSTTNVILNPTNKNSYDVKITRAEDTSYNAFEVTISNGLVINALDITGATITLGDQLTYNGTEQTQLIVSVVCNGITLQPGASGYQVDPNFSNVKTNAGTYTLKVNGSGNFTGTASTQFTVLQKAVSIIIDTDNYTFTNEVQAINAKFIDENGQDKELDVFINGTFKNVGEYTVTVSFKTGVTNYKFNGTSEFKYHISKATTYITSVNMEGWTYGETAKDPSVSRPTTSLNFGTPTYSYSSDGTTFDAGKPTTPGTYTVKATIAETDNWYGTSATNTFTIAKATVSIADVTFENDTVTYDGQPHSILIDGTLPTGLIGGIQVTYDGNGQTDAGTYTITANFTVNSTLYNDIASKTATLTINQAQATIDVTNVVKEYTYNGNTFQVQSGATTNSDGVISYPNTLLQNANTYSITITVPATKNYTAGSATFDVVVNKADVTFKTDTMQTIFTYNGSEQSVTSGAVPQLITGNGPATVSYSNNKFTNAGTYKVIVTTNELPNYKAGYLEVEVTVNKASCTIDASGVETDYTYTGNVITYSGSATCTSNCDLTYNYSKEMINAGQYQIIISGVETSNYLAPTTVHHTVRVNKATTVIESVSIDGWTYGASPNSPSCTTNVVTTKYYTYSTSEDGTYTATVPTNAGTYWLKAEVCETGDYTAAIKKMSFTISKATPTIDTTGVTASVAYTGDPITIDSGATCISGGTITYTNNTFTDIGKHTITISVAETSNYTATSTTFDVTVTPAQNKINNLSITGWTYGETPNAPTATADFGTPTFDIYDNTKASIIVGVLNAGTYWVKATVTATESYAGATDWKQFTVSKATYNMSGVSWNYTNPFTYDTNEKEVTITGTLPDGVSVKEYANNKKTNAGDYTATVTFNYDTTNYNEPTLESLSWKINKATASIDTTNVNLSYIYDGTLKTIDSGATLNHSESTLSYTNNTFTNAGDHVVTISAPESDNYNAVSTTVTANVAKGQAVITVDQTPIVKTYDGIGVTVPTATANFGATVKCDKTSADLINVDTYTITYTVDDTDNYNGATETVSVTINKGQAEITLDQTAVVVTYDPAGLTPKSASSNFGTPTCNYTSATLKDAGEYTVTYTVEGTANYDGDTKSYSVTINKADPVITTNNVIKTYTYNTKEITISSGATLNHTETTLVYSNNKFTDADTYTVTISAAATKNYNAATTTVDITVKRAAPVITFAGGTNEIHVTYTGSDIIVTTELLGATLNNTEQPIKVRDVYGNVNPVVRNAGDSVVNGSLRVEYSKNYNQKSFYYTLIVDKADAVITDLYIEGWTYGDTPNLPSATNNFGEIVYTYYDETKTNVQTGTLNAGTHWVKASIEGTSNYNGTEAWYEFEIAKAQATIDKTGVQTEYTYTGNEITVNSGAILNHTETTLVYINNTFINADTYTVSIYAEETTNYLAADTVTVQVTVNPAQNKINDLSITGWTYGETPNEPSATADFGGTPTFDIYDSTKTNTIVGVLSAGTYWVKATVEATSNYAGATDWVEFTVSKATYNMNGVVWNYSNPFTYDGTEKEVTITGTLPDGVSVNTYSNNKATNASDYTATVTFNYDTTNYNEPTLESLSWKINKATATIDTSAVQTSYTYDGNEITVSGATLNHSETELVYTNYQFTDANTYTVTINAAETTNYLAAQTSVDVTVNKATATIDTSAVQTSYTYDGNEITVSGAVLNHSETELVYTNYQFTNANTYTVTISAIETTNYLAVSVDIDVIVDKAIATINTDSIVKNYVYDGNTVTINKGAVLNHSEAQLTYTNNSFANAGTHSVTISAPATTNYYAVTTSIDIIIDKADAEISAVGVLNEYTYDGNEITINSGAILNHSETTLVYSDNAFTNAGLHLVKITAAETANYYGTSVDVPVVVKQAVATIDVSGVQTTYTYSGNEITINSGATLNHSETELVYTYNTFTNANTYVIKISAEETTNYKSTFEYVEITVNKYTYDMSGVTFANQTFVYSGEAHNLVVSGSVPEGVTVSYEGNNKTEAGSYLVVAKFDVDTENFNTIDNKNATMTINKAVYNMSDITFVDYTCTYDGEVHALAISGTLPEGVNVEYKNNNKTNAGVYTVTAKFTGDSKNYEAINDMVATLTINKNTYDVSGISLNDLVVTYDGNAHSILIDGTLPNGLDIAYTNNAQTEAGTYDITATFVGDFDNYNSIEDLSATLTIEKATYNMNRILFLDVKVVYDGESHSLAIAGTLPAGVSVEYENNDKVKAGVYKVTAKFTGNVNYNEIPDMAATLTIQKATYNMSAIEFTDVTLPVDGETHNILLTGTLPEGVLVNYYVNDVEFAGSKEIGVYNIVARFTVDEENYNHIEDMVARLEIKSKTVAPVDPYNPYAKPDVIIEAEEGFPENIVIEVKAYEGKKLNDPNLLFDYTSIEIRALDLLKCDEVRIVYSIDLYEAVEGELKKANIDSLGDNVKVILKMLLPEDFDLEDVTSIIHAHSKDDVTSIDISNATIDENGYLCIEITKLSEFALVAKPRYSCITHWFMAITLAAFIALFIIVWFVLRMRKLNLLTFAIYAAYIVAITIEGFLASCKYCQIGIVVNTGVLIGSLILFVVYDTNKRKKDEESIEEENARLRAEIERLQSVQEIMDDKAVSLKDTIRIVTALDVKNSTITKESVSQYLKQKYGDAIVSKRRPNYIGTGLPLPDTHYTMVNGKSSCFLFVYELKTGQVFFMIKATEDTVKEIHEKHPRVKKSSFPKSNSQWYSVYIDQTYKSSVDVFEMISLVYAKLVGTKENKDYEMVQLKKRYEKLKKVEMPKVEEYNGDDKVEVIDVCFAEKKKLYVFLSNGLETNEGDTVKVDTINGIRIAMVVHKNHFMDPKTHEEELKNALEIIKNDKE